MMVILNVKELRLTVQIVHITTQFLFNYLEFLIEYFIPWQIFLIILKLFFKKWRESEDFFILRYLFRNVTIDILKNHIGFADSELIHHVYKVIIQFKSFKYITLLVGKSENTTFVTSNKFLHFFNDVHCLIWTFDAFAVFSISSLAISLIIVDFFTCFIIFSLVFLISFVVTSVLKFLSWKKT